ncbi:MAG: class I tRNA ligase family protein, partial [Clostridia bacterium]|nr:class I tRNA ligase family protein [Clostridia bacterium]
KVASLPEIMKGEGYSEKLESSMHKLIKKVTYDIDNMKFNTAIAAMMAFINEVYEFGSITKDELVTFIKLLNPFAPHLTEEMWENMGNTTFISLEKWPEYDEAKTVENTIEIAVQINGRLRSTITIAKDSSKDDAIASAKADEKVAEALDGKTVVKEIYVPGRIVNIVVK